MNNRVRTGLIVLGVLMWGVNGVVFLTDPHYQGFGQFSSAVAAIVGTLMATYRREDRPDDEEE